MANPVDVIIGGVVAAAGIAVSFIPIPGAQYIGATIFSYGTGRIISGIVGSPREQAARRAEGVKFNVRSTQANIPIVYGTARVGLKISDIRVISSAEPSTPSADPTLLFAGADNNDVLCKVGAICVGSEDGSGIVAIRNIRVYDDGVNVVGTPGAFSSAPAATGVISKYANDFKYIIEDGDDLQVPRTELQNQLGWTTAYEGAGIAYFAGFFNYNEEVWNRGVPQVTMEVDGVRVFDPRDDTWKFSDNPALCILDYLTSKRYGAGIPYAARDGGSLDFIDEQSFIDAANYCDDLVSIPGASTEKRFLLNGVVQTDRVVGANLVEMLATCRGELIWQNGAYRLIIRQPTTAETFELTENNIVGAIEWMRKGTSIPNAIEVTFPTNENGDFVPDSISWPLVGDTTFLVEDGGQENRVEASLPFTVGRYQAIRTAMVMLREARQDVFVNLTAFQAAYQLEVGDVVNVTHSGPAWTQKPFMVRQVGLTPDGLVRLSLQSYSASVYSLDSLNANPAIPGTLLPDPERAYTTVSIVDDRFISQGAQTGESVPTEAWKRRLRVQTGSNTRSLTITYDFDRPGLAGGGPTNFSRNYTVPVNPSTLHDIILQDGAAADQLFFARDDNGTTLFDEAVAVTLTPNSLAAAAGFNGNPAVSGVLDLADEDDVGFRVKAEVKVIERSLDASAGDAWLAFSSSVNFFAQSFTMPSGDNRELASLEFLLRKVGNPSSFLTFEIRADNAGEPSGTILGGSDQFTADDLDTVGVALELAMGRETLTAGATYWAICVHQSSTGTDYVEVRVDQSSPTSPGMGNSATSDETETWTTSSARMAAGFYVRRYGEQFVPARNLSPDASRSVAFSWESGGIALSATGAGGGGGATTLGGLSDVTLTSPAAGKFLRHNGTAWVDSVIQTADITAAMVTQHQASIDHDALLNFVADEHVAHSGVSIVAGIGLTGGGTIAATRTLDLDIVGLTDGVPTGADRLPFHSDGVGPRKRLISLFPLSAFQNDAGFVTSAFNVAGAGLSGSAPTVNVNYVGGVDSVIGAAGDGLAVGTLATTDLILFGDGSDSNNVKFAQVGQLPFTNNTGDVESVANDTNGGLAVTNGGGPNVTLALDILNLADAVPTGADRLPFHDDAVGSRKRLISLFPLSIFQNDAGFVTNAFNVAGAGLSGTPPTVDINYGAGSDNVITAAPTTITSASGIDAMILADGGLTSAVAKIQLQSIDVGVFNDDGTYLTSVSAPDVGAGQFVAGMSFADLQIGFTAQTLATVATGTWDLPVGSSRFVDVSLSVGEPAGSDDLYWFTLGRRDTGGGYGGLAMEYDSGVAWFGYNLLGTADPTWVRVGTVFNVTTGSGLGGTITTSGQIDLDFNALGDRAMVGADKLVFYSPGGAGHFTDIVSTIGLSVFNNDAGFVTSAFNNAGAGLSGSPPTVNINYAAGSDNVITAAPNTPITPAGIDAMIIADGGLTGAVEAVQLNTVPVSVWQDDGTYAAASHTHPASQVTAGTFASGDFTFQGRVFLADGAVATPAYSFTGQTTTGMYVADGPPVQLLFSVENTAVFGFTSSTGVLAGLFTATTSGNEHIRLNHTSATGSPFINFRQAGTSRGSVGYNDATTEMYISVGAASTSIGMYAGGGERGRFSSVSPHLRVQGDGAETLRVNHTSGTGSPVIALHQNNVLASSITHFDTSDILAINNVQNGQVSVRYNGTERFHLSNTGKLTIVRTVNDNHIRMEVPDTNGVRAQLIAIRGGEQRWQWGMDGSAETGSNAGNDFGFYAYDDAGSFVGGPLTLYRGTLLAKFGGNVHVDSGQLWIDEKSTQLGTSPTIDWDESNVQHMTNSGSNTVNIGSGSMHPGGVYILKVTDAVGAVAGFTWSSTATLIWQDGNAPTFPQSAGDVTLIFFHYIDSEVIGSYFLAT